MEHHIRIGSQAPDIINVVIEIPRGSHNKYEYDEALNAIKLDRVLYSPFFYPLDYGFIPETRSEDGDHLDVLVVTSDPLFPGCVVEARPIAILKMIDRGDADEKILAVAAADPRFAHVESLSDLALHLPKELSHFFETYKTLEGKKVEVRGWGDRDEALAVVRDAQACYQKP